MTKVVFGFALLTLLPTAATQRVSTTPREAALRFALANGITLPTTNVIVAYDVDFQAIDGSRSKATREQLETAATNLARAVGPNARAGAAESFLTCVRSACVPSSQPVIVVNEADETPTGTAVYLRVFLPSDSAEYDGYKWIVVVDVERRESGWVGVGNRLGPTKIGVRLNK